MLTCDTLFNGKLIIYQPKKGYRFAIDAVLLAGLTRVRPSDRIVDLGTGCGVIPLDSGSSQPGKADRGAGDPAGARRVGAAECSG